MHTRAHVQHLTSLALRFGEIEGGTERSSCSVACLCLPCSTPTEALVAAWTARPEPQGALPRLMPISTLMCN